MPYPITQGLGYQGDSAGSGLMVTRGLGSPGDPYLGATFALLLIEVYDDRLELVFSTNVQVSGLATILTNWYTTSAGPYTVPVVTSVEASGARIILYMTEGTSDQVYTLHLPAAGIQDLSSNPYTGPFTYDYLFSGAEPYVALAGAEDGFHVRVIFSEAVVTAEALDPANYAITGGGGLTVYEVEQETAQTYVLRTSLQSVGTSYTVTVSNIHDLAGNLI